MGNARFFTFLMVTTVLAACTGGARAEQGDELLGNWEGTSGGLKETWTISRDKDGWSVVGTFRSGDREVGSFRGTNVRLSDGVLGFRQDFLRKPQPNWRSGNQMTVQAAGDTLNVTWRNGKQSGRSTLARKGTAAVKEEPVKKLSEEAQKELARLEGKWQFRTFQLDGKKIEFGAVWQFKGEAVTETIGLPRRSGTVKVEPGKSPKEIDINFTKSDGGGMTGLFRGVYELEGEKLTICLGTGGNRPDKLESAPESKTLLIVFQRSK